MNGVDDRCQILHFERGQFHTHTHAHMRISSTHIVNIREHAANLRCLSSSSPTPLCQKRFLLWFGVYFSFRLSFTIRRASLWFGHETWDKKYKTTHIRIHIYVNTPTPHIYLCCWPNSHACDYIEKTLLRPVNLKCSYASWLMECPNLFCIAIFYVVVVVLLYLWSYNIYTTYFFYLFYWSILIA